MVVLVRKGKPEALHNEIASLVDEWEIQIVVVGMPLSLDGSMGPAAQKATSEVRRLSRRLSVPVETYDERLTTVTAHRFLQDQNLSEKKRRDVVDMAAAAVILQSWLDQKRSTDHHGVFGSSDPPS